MSEILDQLKKAVLEGEDDLAVRLSQEALDASINPIEISKIIISGIGEAGELWKKNL
ncbi:B12-binding domain-containing protein, partial [Chloroflexota bacterium]